MTLVGFFLMTTSTLQTYEEINSLRTRPILLDQNHAIYAFFWFAFFWWCSFCFFLGQINHPCWSIASATISGTIARIIILTIPELGQEIYRGWLPTPLLLAGYAGFGIGALAGRMNVARSVERRLNRIYDFQNASSFAKSSYGGLCLIATARVYLILSKIDTETSLGGLWILIQSGLAVFWLAGIMLMGSNIKFDFPRGSFYAAMVSSALLGSLLRYLLHKRHFAFHAGIMDTAFYVHTTIVIATFLATARISLFFAY